MMAEKNVSQSGEERRPAVRRFPAGEVPGLPLIDEVERTPIPVMPMHWARILVAIEDEVARRYPDLTPTRVHPSTLGSPEGAGYRWGRSVSLWIYFGASPKEAAQMLRRQLMRVSIGRRTAVPHVSDEAYTTSKEAGHGMLGVCYGTVYIQVSTANEMDHREIAQIVINAVDGVVGR